MTTQNLGSFDDWGRRPNPDEKEPGGGGEPAWWTDGSNHQPEPTQAFPAPDPDPEHRAPEHRPSEHRAHEQPGRGAPPAPSWTPPNETVDGAPSGGWGTPGDHLTGPLPRLRQAPSPFLMSPEESGRGRGGATAVGATESPRGYDGPAPGYPEAPPSGRPSAPGMGGPPMRGGAPDPGRGGWGGRPQAQGAPPEWGTPNRGGNGWGSQAPAWPEAAPPRRTGEGEEAGAGALVDFGLRRRATRRLSPVVYTLVVAAALVAYVVRVVDAVLHLDEAGGFALATTAVLGLLLLLVVVGGTRLVLELCRNVDRLAHEKSESHAPGQGSRG